MLEQFARVELDILRDDNKLHCWICDTIISDADFATAYVSDAEEDYGGYVALCVHCEYTDDD